METGPLDEIIDLSATIYYHPKTNDNTSGIRSLQLCCASGGRIMGALTMQCPLSATLYRTVVYYGYSLNRDANLAKIVRLKETRSPTILSVWPY